MPKIRQTNKVMKVGNQWLPAFLNSVNGSPTYTYMNDSGQWADASGNTYNVEHPLDEVTMNLAAHGYGLNTNVFGYRIPEKQSAADYYARMMDKEPYYNIFYNPASPTEAIWRKTLQK